MFCYHCGNEMKDGVIYCSKCGTAISQNAEEEAAVTEEQIVDEKDFIQIPEVKQKKNWHNKALGIFIFVIMAGLCIVQGRELMNDPFEKVISAWNKTAANNAGDSLMEQATGIGKAINAAVNNASSVRGNLSLVQAPFSLDPNDRLSGIDIAYQLEQDIPNKKFYFNSYFNMDEKNIMGIELFANNEQIKAAMPGMVEGYFSVPMKNLGKAYKDSLFNQSQPMDIADDYSLMLYPEAYPEEASPTHLVFKTKNKEWLQRFKAEATADRLGYTDLWIDDTTSLNCQAYTISITPDKATALLQEYVQFLKTDTDVQVYIDELIEEFCLKHYISSVIMKEELKPIQDDLFKGLEQFEINEASFTCYVDKNEIIRYFEVALGCSSYGEFAHIDLTGYLSDTGLRAKDNLYIQVLMQAGLVSEMEEVLESDGLLMEFRSSQYEDGDSIITEGECNMGNSDDEGIKTNWNLAYNTMDSAYVFHAALTADGQESKGGINAYSNGTLQIPIKGESFNLIMDTIDFTTSDSFFKDKLRLEGAYRFDNSIGTMTQPTGTEYKLLEMNESELYAIKMEMAGNIEKLMNEMAIIYN